MRGWAAALFELPDVVDFEAVADGLAAGVAAGLEPALAELGHGHAVEHLVFARGAGRAHDFDVGELAVGADGELHLGGVGGGLTLTSGGGTNDGGGGANLGGGGRFSGGGGGGGLTSSMILVSIGALITSIMRCARPVTSAQPNSTCRATTMPKPIRCRPGLRCC